MNPFDRVVEIATRTEEVHTVMPAVSLNNIYQGVEIPQNPGLAENNYNSPHQDSYCSESVGLSGPTGKKLKLIRQFNKYGFTPTMVCNAHNQMIGVAFDQPERQYRLIVFDKNCNIISATKTAKLVENSFGGGYFYLNENNNTIVIANNKIANYPTAEVQPQAQEYSLEPIWSSDDIVDLVDTTGADNTLYSAMPVWDANNPNLYWCLIAGNYDFDTGALNSHAYIAVVEITPDPSKPSGCVTTLKGKLPLPRQWNNNTFSVGEEGAYFVTNGLNSEGVCNEGYLYSVAYDASTGAVSERWRYAYENSGFLKPGQTNIGSGTTPTLTVDAQGNGLVAITDNAYPYLHVDVVSRENGTLVSQTPVFAKMRGCDEASLIGVGNRFVVENNFGHTVDYPRSQYVPNEPGMDMIEVSPSTPGSAGDIVWENNHTCFFAMNMLARESGIIYAHTCDWYDDISATKGGMYNVIAIDAWDGRIIWRIPLGRGLQYCHEYGGIYFNRDNDLFIGTNRYLISIQDCIESE